MTAYALDHVAIAVREWRQAAVLAESFGGRWLFGVHLPTHSPAQLLFAHDMRIELLEPGTAPESFIRRFLDEQGDAARPHHLTFKVPDIRTSLTRAKEDGFEPILVNLQHEFWMEYFLHPATTGLGFLTQVVQGESPTEEQVDQAGDVSGGPPWPAPTAARATLPLVLARVEDPDRALALLSGLLGGVATTVAPGVTSIRWPQGADLVLTSGAAGAPLGVHSLAFGSHSDEEWNQNDIVVALEAGVFDPALGLCVAELHSVRSSLAG